MEKAATLIRELEMRELQDAEKYEKCETIAGLAPQEVVDLIEDPQVKEGITWLKKAHKNIPSVTMEKGLCPNHSAAFQRGGRDRPSKEVARVGSSL